MFQEEIINKHILFGKQSSNNPMGGGPWPWPWVNENSPEGRQAKLVF